eukprot:Clim_evm23s230 gene=Clim_evmTU23s230
MSSKAYVVANGDISTLSTQEEAESGEAVCGAKDIKSELQVPAKPMKGILKRREPTNEGSGLKNVIQRIGDKLTGDPDHDVLSCAECSAGTGSCQKADGLLSKFSRALERTNDERAIPPDIILPGKIPLNMPPAKSNPDRFDYERQERIKRLNRSKTSWWSKNIWDDMLQKSSQKHSRQRGEILTTTPASFDDTLLDNENVNHRDGLFPPPVNSHKGPDSRGNTTRRHGHRRAVSDSTAIQIQSDLKVMDEMNKEQQQLDQNEESSEDVNRGSNQTIATMEDNDSVVNRTSGASQGSLNATAAADSGNESACDGTDSSTFKPTLHDHNSNPFRRPLSRSRRPVTIHATVRRHRKPDDSLPSVRRRKTKRTPTKTVHFTEDEPEEHAVWTKEEYERGFSDFEDLSSPLEDVHIATTSDLDEEFFLRWKTRKDLLRFKVYEMQVHPDSRQYIDWSDM